MPMTERSKSRARVFRVQLFPASVLQFLMLLMYCTHAAVLYAQTVELKVVNGRNGRPIADQCMNVWVGDESNARSAPLLETQTDANGIIRLRLTDEDTKTDLESQQLVCGLRGVTNPIVKYGDTISIRVGYVLCQSRTAGYSWLAITDFSTKQVVQQGVVTKNTCGKATASPKPGELILFVRPLSWWERLKQ